MSEAYVGIDVQLKRGCAYAILNAEMELVDHGWFPPVRSWRVDVEPALAKTVRLVEELRATGKSVHVGIDSPRRPLASPRLWSCRGGRWYRDGTGKGHGRHCEAVLKALRVANPQWTPTRSEAKPWMVFGFEMFEALDGIADVHEVFPSASYRLLADCNDANLEIPLPYRSLVRGPKDFLDAVVAAITVRAFCRGEGTAVGGGDGYGRIILPYRLGRADADHGVHAWPGSDDLGIT